MSIDKYFTRRFNLGEYNCWDLVREVMLDLTGKDIGKRTPFPVTRGAIKDNFKEQEKQFKKLEQPVEPCIVLLRRPKVTPHVGVFLKGKVLHINETGVEYQPLDIVSRGFTEIGYYIYE